MADRHETKADLTTYLSQSDAERLRMIAAKAQGEEMTFLLEILKESLVAFALLDATTTELETLPSLPGYAELAKQKEFAPLNAILVTAVAGNRQALENFKARSARGG